MVSCAPLFRMFCLQVCSKGTRSNGKVALWLLRLRCHVCVVFFCGFGQRIRESSGIHWFAYKSWRTIRRASTSETSHCRKAADRTVSAYGVNMMVEMSKWGSQFRFQKVMVLHPSGNPSSLYNRARLSWIFRRCSGAALVNVQ